MNRQTRPAGTLPSARLEFGEREVTLAPGQFSICIIPTASWPLGARRLRADADHIVGSPLGHGAIDRHAPPSVKIRMPVGRLAAARDETAWIADLDAIRHPL
jgi:hypothetical protein